MKTNQLLIITTVLIFGVVGGSLASVAHKDVLFKTHNHNEVSCQDCHSAPDQVVAQNSACLNCHGSIDEMAKLTDKPDASGGQYMGNVNPHRHHLGPMECFSCHSIHKRTDDTNPCIDCHSLFTLDLP